MSTEPQSDSPNYRLKDVEKPYKDPEVLHRLYWHEEMNQTQIAEHLGCGQGTVGEWMRKLHVPRRSQQESYNLNMGRNYQPLEYDHQGYEGWQVAQGIIYVHRLLAINEWGTEAVAGNLIHHKNGIPWDNRIENLKIVSPEEHMREHRKITGTNRLAVAEKYEHGDISSRNLGDLYGVSGSTVLGIHQEFYGDGND